jgi:hypothetical protein
MRNQWKGRTQPNLDHIASLFDNQELGAFIVGHLLLESVIVQLIELKLTEGDNIKLFDLNFASKLNMAKSRGLIDDKMFSFLLEVNKFRNRLAHRLGEPIEFEGMFDLVKMASDSGVEFSDTTIYTNLEEARDSYGVQGLIQELFQNAAQDLSFLMDQHGGAFQFA